MATYEVNDDIFPNKTVVYIRCKFQGKEGWGNGSGTIVGKNDILTASHVVYDERYDGWATETRIYTSRNAYLSNSSSYYTYKWARGRNWDENGDGLLAQGDNKYNSLYETENDIALLSLATDIGSIYGSMGLKFDFQSGTASKLGYPGKYNYNLYYDEGFVDKHSVDNYFQFDKDEIEINGGDSGGPIYVNSGGNAGYQVIGIISGKGTISGNGTACALNAHSTWIKDEIESNNYLYDKSFATITSPESVDEGSSISFTFKTHKSEENTQYTYTLSGVSSSDFSSTELSGTTTIDKNGEATFTLDISADQATEGTESFTLSIGEKTKSISINDTSIDEVVPIIIGPSGSHGDTTSTKTINENSSDIHIFKANETVTWSLNGGLDAAKFTIDSSTGALIFNTSPNYEFPTDSDSNNDYIVVVRATDSTGNASNQTVTVSINNLNETPTSFLLSTYNFNENIAAGTTVGTLYGVDEDTSDTHTFSFLPGFTQSEGNSAFTIDGNKLKIKNSPNYEIQKSYTIVIKATDQSGESSKGAYYRTLTVNDLNETPTALTLSSSSFNENIAAASAVATLSSTDPDSSDTHTYSLVIGTGDTDNNSFAIDGSALKIKAEPDYETKYAYKIRLQTTDSGGETYSKALTLSVNDLNELYGTTGKDTVTSTSENDYLDGGTETDTLIYSGKFSNYSFTRGTDTLQISDQRTTGTTDGTDTLKNIEYIQFSDQTIEESKVDVVKIYTGNFHDYKFYNKGNGVYQIKTDSGYEDITGYPSLTFSGEASTSVLRDVSAIADIKGVFDQITGLNTYSGRMFRLYNSAFKRLPDADGLKYWIDNLSSGANDDKIISKSFIISDEFSSRYGSNVTNEKYIETLYLNVLGRTYDQEGYDYWFGKLNNGRERYQLLLDFAESAENKTLFTEMTGVG